MIKKIRSFLINILTVSLGNVLVIVLPKKASELQKKGLSFFVDSNPTLIDKLMRRALLRKAEKGNPETLGDMHKNFWINQGHKFCSVYEDRLINNDLPKTEFIFELLSDKLEESPNTYETLVEIGCGNGYVLSYLSRKFQQIDRFIGVDLSSDQIQLNQAKYAGNKKLEFVAKDITEWIQENKLGNTIFVTFMGVMEYLNENELISFIKEISTMKNILFVAIEPIGSDHDFSFNPHSQPYGYERSFSHNYPKIFKDHGFGVWHLSYLPNNGFFKLCTIGAVKAI